MFVSVVIPNRNGAATIGKCIEAALRSRYEGFEVIVVDDASEDDSIEVASRFPCRLIRLERHSGTSRARNRGAHESRGGILFFTDADCVLREDTLALARETLSREEMQAVAGGTYTPLPHDRRFFSTFQSLLIHHSESRMAGSPDYLPAHCLAVPAPIFRASGGFREDFLPILEDVEYSHRLRRMGCRLVLNPAMQVQHIFNHSLGRSLANAARKSRYWTLYSLGNGDLLADSGVASRELKMNGAAYLLCALLLALFVATGTAAFLAVLAGCAAVNLYANGALMRTFYGGGSRCFAIAAAAYYLLLYPLAVWTGALVGAFHYLAVHAAGRRER
jgi:glycosyltransferase involved in cell wall biosynthesis